jgi:hypothetical protein
MLQNSALARRPKKARNMRKMPDVSSGQATIPARVNDDDAPDLAELGHKLLIALTRKKPMPKQQITAVFAFEAHGERTLYGRAESEAEARQHAAYVNVHRLNHLQVRALSVAEAKQIPSDQIFDVAAQMAKRKVVHRPIFRG